MIGIIDLFYIASKNDSINISCYYSNHVDSLIRVKEFMDLCYSIKSTKSGKNTRIDIMNESVNHLFKNLLRINVLFKDIEMNIIVDYDNKCESETKLAYDGEYIYGTIDDSNKKKRMCFNLTVKYSNRTSLFKLFTALKSKDIRKSIIV